MDYLNHAPKKQKRKEKNRKAETDTGAQLSDLNKLESQVLGITGAKIATMKLTNIFGREILKI